MDDGLMVMVMAATTVITLTSLASSSLLSASRSEAADAREMPTAAAGGVSVRTERTGTAI